VEAAKWSSWVAIPSSKNKKVTIRYNKSVHALFLQVNLEVARERAC
jgi:hypothetical protein